MLGDSMVKTIDGQLSGEPSTWAAELGMNNVVNQGYNGLTTTQAATLGPLTWTINENPDLVYVVLGTNDAISGTSLAVTMANFTTICSQLKANNIPFVLTLPPPISQDFTWNGAQNSTIQSNYDALNAEIIQFCIDNGYRYMDLKHWIGYQHSSGNINLKDEYSVDGVHLNNAGYKRWCVYLSYDINQH